jgi:hypothetical protein
MVRIKKILSLFFAVLFVSYYAGIAFFSHAHIISGATVFHSHFHAETHHDTDSGGHTEQSITLIAQISNFNYIDFSCDCVLKPLQLQLYENNCMETVPMIFSIHLENPSLRAPPII